MTPMYVPTHSTTQTSPPQMNQKYQPSNYPYPPQWVSNPYVMYQQKVGFRYINPLEHVQA